MWKLAGASTLRLRMNQNGYAMKAKPRVIRPTIRAAGDRVDTPAPEPHEDSQRLIFPAMAPRPGQLSKLTGAKFKRGIDRRPLIFSPSPFLQGDALKGGARDVCHASAHAVQTEAILSGLPVDDVKTVDKARSARVFAFPSLAMPREVRVSPCTRAAAHLSALGPPGGAARQHLPAPWQRVS